MRRAGILGVAIVLVLGLAVGSSQAAKAKKVASSVDIDGFANEPEFSFVGNVYAKKAKCVRNREVTVFFTDEGAHDPVGTTTTDQTGDWVFPAETLEIGDYEAEVAKKRVGKGEKKLVCKAGVSPTFDNGFF
jgi:hypothetical protein